MERALRPLVVPLSSLGPIAAAGPIAAGPEPVAAAGVNLTPPGPGSFTATFLCITVGVWMMPSSSETGFVWPTEALVPSSGDGLEPPLWSGSAWDASAASGGLMGSGVVGDATEFRF